MVKPEMAMMVSPTPTRGNPRMTGLYTLTILLSAFLLFLTQPLCGRLILPYLGGTPAVWNTAMWFFQLVLLAGYAYAHCSLKWIGWRVQPWLHLGVFLPDRAYRRSGRGLSSTPASRDFSQDRVEIAKIHGNTEASPRWEITATPDPGKLERCGVHLDSPTSRSTPSRNSFTVILNTLAKRRITGRPKSVSPFLFSILCINPLLLWPISLLKRVTLHPRSSLSDRILSPKRTILSDNNLPFLEELYFHLATFISVAILSVTATHEWQLRTELTRR